jgi:aldose 1-epimerase
MKFSSMYLPAVLLIVALGVTASRASEAARSPAGAPAAKSTEPATQPAKESKMTIEKAPYGKLTNGTEIEQYTLTNSKGMKVKVITYGAIITCVETPDRDGKMANITLYMDNLASYVSDNSPYFGCVPGRYANRIAKAQFTLDGTVYKLAPNNNGNTLHGGKKGFDKCVWTAKEVKGDGSVGVALTLVSPDGDEGYPGKLTATVTYSLTEKNELKMEYTATTDKPTVVNLTNHAYWNLAGAGNGTVLGQELMINADQYLPVDSGLIPLGDPAPVKDTPMDFTKPMTIGSRIDKVQGGYDHNYNLNKKPGEEMSLAAKVVDPKSGRVMVVTTTQPGVQLYTANFLDGSIKADGGKISYPKYGALCLETQHYPDSPNHPKYPTTVLKPGETYKQTTIYTFSVQ